MFIEKIFRRMIDAGGITRGWSDRCGEIIGLSVRPLSKFDLA
jgi:hypothetical protein